MRYILILCASCVCHWFPELVSAQQSLNTPQRSHTGQKSRSSQRFHSAPVRNHRSYHRGKSYPRYYGRTWANPGFSVGGRYGNFNYSFPYPGSSYYGNPWGPYVYNRFGTYQTNAFIAGDPVLFSGGYSLNGFYPILPGLGFSPPAVYPYSNVPGTLPTLPSQPPLNYPASSNLPLNNTLNQDLARWSDPNYLPQPSKKIKRHIIPSTPQAKELSLRNQVKGDKYFKELDYRRAYDRYKLAASLTKDLATPHFKKGFALVALGQYKRAAYEFKQGLALDPSWPVTGQSLIDLYGADHVLAKDAAIHRVAEWVKEDIRDAERLFVFGVMLHFDGQAEKAYDVFKTAGRLAGSGDHLLAFLDPKRNTKINQAVKQKGSQSGFVVDPKHTRAPAFQSNPKNPSKSSAPVSKSLPLPTTLPPPPSTTNSPKVNSQSLPPLPEDAKAPGEPLIPLPEPAKSQQSPVLIPPQ